ncbi:MAG: cell division protein FtsL [Candidatus Aminicenantes bacterium]|nr:cell division protein FtsL [Candidatus Aminicenantes bacterium]
MVHKKFTRRQLVFTVGTTLAVVFILSFYLWQIAETVSLGYEANNAENAKRALEKEVLRLQAEKAALLSLERVERTARTELGLSDPREDQIIYEDFK